MYVKSYHKQYCMMRGDDDGRMLLIVVNAKAFAYLVHAHALPLGYAVGRLRFVNANGHGTRWNQTFGY